jgi:hypothetical protein
MVVLALTLLSIIFFILASPVPVKYRFYSGDRITGTFNIKVNGVDYNPIEEMLEYDNEKTQRLTNGYSGFSIKGGAYGSYKISFSLDNKELYSMTGDSFFMSYTSNPILTYQYINTNWWHVTKMTLTAEIVLVNDEWIVNTKIVYSEPLENGTISEHTLEKSFTYDEIMQNKGIVQFGL